MYRVFSTVDVERAYRVQQALASHGIDSTLRNEHLAHAKTSNLTPFLRDPLRIDDLSEPLYIEVWVEAEDAMQGARAEQIVRELLAEGVLEEPEDESAKTLWRCAECGEGSEKQFTSCWKCGQSRL